MILPHNQSAAPNRRPAGQPDVSCNLSATVAADRAFPAAVAELGGSPSLSAMQKDESFVDWVPRLGSFLAGLVLLYFLAAPPVIVAAFKQSGGSRIPTVYQPVIRIIESDFGGPLVWYFNSVWHAELILLGDESGPPWYMVLLYVVIGIGLAIGVLFPFIRRIRRRTT